jgi:hypothetical protein
MEKELFRGRGRRQKGKTLRGAGNVKKAKSLGYMVVYNKLPNKIHNSNKNVAKVPRKPPQNCGSYGWTK